MAKAVLDFCYTPRSRAEIITLTGKSQTYTMNYIVKPLLEKGLLRMTNPEKPKSNKQKYVAVSN
ncbi:Fic family protein [uncultured Succinivibrio sp.]|uniref:Fic family protein n=1 Tax=uncultured Succinivibrio sp. TaxID=540749 RepID=UPI003458429A